MWLLQQAQKMSPSKLAAEFAAEEDIPATFTREDIIREGSEPFTDDDNDEVGAFGTIEEECEWYKAELRRVHQVSFIISPSMPLAIHRPRD